MPGGKDVGANIRELKASKTKRPQKQIVAIALSEARRAGNESVGPKPKTGAGADKHPGFAAAQSSIAKRQGISEDRAGAILAAGARKASAKAVKKNPNLKRVSGVGKK